MRVNIYAEEMTDRIEIIAKTIDGQEFTGCRFYLELPASTFKYAVGQKVSKDVSKSTHENEVLQIQGPFIHRPDDDDSAAVTFWGKKDLRQTLAKALDLLDDHYDDGESHHITRVNMAFQMAGPETAGVVLEVARERNRQISAEGWTTDHDDRHSYGEMARAAGCYAHHTAPVSRTAHRTPSGLPISWPWDFKWWKPTTPRRDLIKAAALIVAEIERIDRQASNVSRETGEDHA